MTKYELEKKVWTDADFERMGWHDATIRALGFDDDEHGLLVDLDYIFEWIHPEVEGGGFEFWTAPVVMNFADVSSLSLSFAEEPSFLLRGIEVQDLHRQIIEPSRDEHLYKFELSQGEISFNSSGYQMIVTGEAVRNSSQSLTVRERNGLGRFGRSMLKLHSADPS